MDGLSPADLDKYAAGLSRVPDVSAATDPTGTFVDGNRVGPPAAATGLADGSAFLTVSSTAPLFSQSNDTQLNRLHQVAGPAGRPVEMAGVAQVNRDSVDAVTDRLPTVLGVIPGRVTYVIDRTGTVRHVFSSMTNIGQHVSDALEMVRQLQAEQAA